MEKFEYLVKKRSQALGLFNKVLKRLDNVQSMMHHEIEHSTHTIKEHEDKIKESQTSIEENKAAISFLESEKVKLLETRVKINSFLE